VDGVRIDPDALAADLAELVQIPSVTGQERAALAWAESVTRLPDNDVSDELYAATQRHFSDKELTDLTFAVITINAWNRLAVPFRNPAGTYQPGKHQTV